MIVEGLAAVVAGLSLGGPSATFRDAVGEDPAAPDITTVVASSSGFRLALRVNVPNRPVLTDDMRLRIWLDVDDDRDTGLIVEGTKTGLDYQVFVDRWELGPGVVGVLRCVGSICGGGGAADVVSFTYREGVARFELDVSDLGLARPGRLRFDVMVMSGVAYDPVERRYDLTASRRDHAPAFGSYWTFDGRPLAVRSFSTTPSRPRAGSLLTSTLNVGPAGRARLGGTSCSLRVGGTTVPARTRSYAAGAARCTFRVPASTSGQRFRLTTSVAAGAERVSRTRTGTVR